MDREKIIEMILLSDAGELADQDKAVLDSALQSDPELAAYARDLSRIRDLSISASPEGPSGAVMARIREAARQEHVIEWPIPMLRLVAAAAAMIIILAGASYVWLKQPDPGPAKTPVAEVKDRVESVSLLIAMVSEEEETAVSATGSSHEQEQAHMEALAAQLLRFQGIDVEPYESALDDDPDAFFDLS